MKYEYDPEADSAYVLINDLPHSYSNEVDETRFIDYSDDGTVIGIELLYIGSGVDTSDLPYRIELIALLAENNVKVFA
jgi:uncharacterized protein YuzE